MFETTIRVLGGILTAHELTGDEALLRRSALCILHCRLCCIYCLIQASDVLGALGTGILQQLLDA